MKLFVLAVLQILATSAFAGSYSTVVCNYAQPRPGGSTFMLVLDNQASKAIVLSKTSGTPQSQWELVSGAANIIQAADGGPSFISTPKAVIDWSAAANQQSCFVMSETLSFQLMIRTNGVVGKMTDRSFPVRNPNKTDCPQVMPPNPNPPLQDLNCELQ